MHLDLNHLYIINYILRIPPLITTGMYCHALGAWGQASGVYVGVAACGKSVSSISRSLVFQTCLLHTSICYFESASDRQSKQIPFVNFKSTRSHSRAGVMIKNKRPYIQALPWMHWNTKKILNLQYDLPLYILRGLVSGICSLTIGSLPWWTLMRCFGVFTSLESPRRHLHNLRGPVIINMW